MKLGKKNTVLLVAVLVAIAGDSLLFLSDVYRDGPGHFWTLTGGWVLLAVGIIGILAYPFRPSSRAVPQEVYDAITAAEGMPLDEVIDEARVEDILRDITDDLRKKECPCPPDLEERMMALRRRIHRK